MKKLTETVVLIIIGIILPLLDNLRLVISWPILNIILYAIALSMSQPTNDNKSKHVDNYDKNSLKLIVLGALLCFLIPIRDFSNKNLLNTYYFDKFSTLTGLTVIWVGFWLRFWSIKSLGKFFTAKIEIKSDHRIIRTGPYKYLRHPSYLGAWMSQVGISIFLKSLSGIFFSSVIYLLIYIYRIRCEEKILTANSPKEYSEYKNETWGILPLIY